MGIWSEATKSDAAIAYCCKEETRVLGPFKCGEIPVQRNV